MTTIVDSDLPVARRHGIILVWNHALCISVAGRFTARTGAVYPSSAGKHDSDWGICEVNLMPGNDRVLIENLKKQQLLYTVAEKARKAPS
ncbi:hypothetical protein ACVXHB_01170 [Escherichia coli]